MSRDYKLFCHTGDGLDQVKRAATALCFDGWSVAQSARLPSHTLYITLDDLLGLLNSPVHVRFPMWGIKCLVKSKPYKYQLLFYVNTERAIVSQNELFNCKIYS